MPATTRRPCSSSFLAAAETGSFSKAAEALSYTPSGVNQLVTALEKELGFPVFRRNTKGVTLTENGELLLPTVREFLRQEDRIFELSAEMNGLLIGSVTIASYSSIATHWLPAVIRAFQQDYPQIRIKLMEGIWQEVSKWLDDRAADIGFLSYQEGMPYDFIPLAEDPMLALLPIWLYNGRRGFSNRAVQYGFYAFYPVHILVLSLIAMYRY